MKFIIITGASRGIGEGIARALLHPENNLICISRTENISLIREAGSARCNINFFRFNLAETGDIPELWEKVSGKIDLQKATGLYLVNNAGVIDPVDRIENCKPGEVDLHMRINLLAPMILTSRFTDLGKGLKIEKRIINISSGAASSPYSGWSSYCTGKAGMEMFTRCVATEQEGTDYPVKCMSVAPGIIDTGMQDNIRGKTREQFIHRDKFVSYKEKGMLADPLAAGKELARLLFSGDFKNGGITDIRNRY